MEGLNRRDFLGALGLGASRSLVDTVVGSGSGTIPRSDTSSERIAVSTSRANVDDLVSLMQVVGNAVEDDVRGYKHHSYKDGTFTTQAYVNGYEILYQSNINSQKEELQVRSNRRSWTFNRDKAVDKYGPNAWFNQRKVDSMLSKVVDLLDVGKQRKRREGNVKWFDSLKNKLPTDGSGYDIRYDNDLNITASYEVDGLKIEYELKPGQFKNLPSDDVVKLTISHQGNVLTYTKGRGEKGKFWKVDINGHEFESIKGKAVAYATGVYDESVAKGIVEQVKFMEYSLQKTIRDAKLNNYRGVFDSLISDEFLNSLEDKDDIIIREYPESPGYLLVKSKSKGIIVKYDPLDPEVKVYSDEVKPYQDVHISAGKVQSVRIRVLGEDEKEHIHPFKRQNDDMRFIESTYTQAGAEHIMKRSLELVRKLRTNQRIASYMAKHV